MIPKIFHLTAKSKTLTWEEQRLLDRARRLHPGWQFKLWDDADNEMLVRTHFPQWLQQYNAIERGVAKADIARYMYMFVEGGVYMDTDYKTLRAFVDPERYECFLPISRGTHTNMHSSEFRLGNAILFSQPNHIFWSSLLEEIFRNVTLSSTPEEKIEETTGPEALTKMFLRNFSDDGSISTPRREDFHPRLTCGGFTFERTPKMFGAHMCWGSWRRKPALVALRTFLRRKLTAII